MFTLRFKHTEDSQTHNTHIHTHKHTHTHKHKHTHHTHTHTPHTQPFYLDELSEALTDMTVELHDTGEAEQKMKQLISFFFFLLIPWLIFNTSY